MVGRFVVGEVWELKKARRGPLFLICGVFMLGLNT